MLSLDILVPLLAFAVSRKAWPSGGLGPEAVRNESELLLRVCGLGRRIESVLSAWLDMSSLRLMTPRISRSVPMTKLARLLGSRPKRYTPKSLAISARYASTSRISRARSSITRDSLSPSAER